MRLFETNSYRLADEDVVDLLAGLRGPDKVLLSTYGYDPHYAALKSVTALIIRMAVYGPDSAAVKRSAPREPNWKGFLEIPGDAPIWREVGYHYLSHAAAALRVLLAHPGLIPEGVPIEELEKVRRHLSVKANVTSDF